MASAEQPLKRVVDSHGQYLWYDSNKYNWDAEAKRLSPKTPEVAAKIEEAHQKAEEAAAEEERPRRKRG